MKKPVWVDVRDALALHDHLLALHGGAAGLRDDALLESALARPQQHFAYGEPFVDGNKRTGFVVGILFLELNGYRFTASEEEAAQAVLQLASGSLDESGYLAFLRANVSREE
jgi:death-on-curing protein